MEQPNLLQALIGYEPIIDRKRTVIALRVRLKATGAPPAALSALYAEMAQDWPAQSHTILVSSPEAILDDGLAVVTPNANVWLEIPAAAMVDPHVQTLVGELHRKAGRHPEAREHFQAALKKAQSASDRQVLQRRLAMCGE